MRLFARSLTSNTARPARTAAGPELIEKLVKRWPEHEAAIRSLAAADPTGNLRWLDWAVKQVRQGADPSAVSQALTELRKQRSLEKTDAEPSQFRSLDDLSQALAQLGSEVEQTPKVLYAKDGWTVTEVFDRAGLWNVSGFDKTNCNWCVGYAQTGNWKTYTAQPGWRLFVVDGPVEDAPYLAYMGGESKPDEIADKYNKNLRYKSASIFDAVTGVLKAAGLEFRGYDTRTQNMNRAEEAAARRLEEAEREYADLLRAADGDVRQLAEVLRQTLVEANWAFRVVVARNPNTPTEILVALASDDSHAVQESVAENPNTPPETLAALSKSSNGHVQSSVARNPNTPPETLAALSRSVSNLVQWGVAANPSTPTEVLTVLAESIDADILKSVARNLNTSPEILAGLADSDNVELQQAVAENPSTPPETLAILAESTVALVPQRVGRNPSTPPEVRERLFQRFPRLRRQASRDLVVTAQDLLRTAAGPELIEKLVKRWPEHEAAIRSLAAADPTGNLRWLDWGVKQVRQGADAQRINAALQLLWDQRRLSLNDKEPSAFASLTDLEQAVQQAGALNEGRYETVHQKDGWTVYRVYDQAALLYTSGLSTKNMIWCLGNTDNKHYWNEYTEQDGWSLYTITGPHYAADAPYLLYYGGAKKNELKNRGNALTHVDDEVQSVIASAGLPQSYPMKGTEATNEDEDEDPVLRAEEDYAAIAAAVPDEAALTARLLEVIPASTVQFCLYLTSLPSTPPEVLAQLVGHANDRVVEFTAKHNNTPPEVLINLLAHPNADVRKYAIRNKNMPPEVLAQLAERQEDVSVLRAVANNTSTPPEVLVRLATHPSYQVLTQVAGNTSTPTAVLNTLAGHDNLNVAYNSAVNPNTSPKSVIQVLQRSDVHLTLREDALRRRYMPPEVLTAFADDRNPEIQRTVAAHPNTPKEVRERLYSQFNRQASMRITAQDLLRTAAGPELIEKLVKRWPAHEDGIRQLASADPTGNLRWLDWGVKQLRGGAQVSDIVAVCRDFFADRDRLGDITQYKTLDAARAALEAPIASEDDDMIPPKVIYRKDGWTLTEIFDRPGLWAVSGMKPTEWCVGWDDDTKWDEYTAKPNWRMIIASGPSPRSPFLAYYGTAKENEIKDRGNNAVPAYDPVFAVFEAAGLEAPRQEESERWRDLTDNLTNWLSDYEGWGKSYVIGDCNVDSADCENLLHPVSSHSASALATDAATELSNVIGEEALDWDYDSLLHWLWHESPDTVELADGVLPDPNARKLVLRWLPDLNAPARVQVMPWRHFNDDNGAWILELTEQFCGVLPAFDAWLFESATPEQAFEAYQALNVDIEEDPIAQAYLAAHPDADGVPWDVWLAEYLKSIGVQSARTAALEDGPRFREEFERSQQVIAQIEAQRAALGYDDASWIPPQFSYDLSDAKYKLFRHGARWADTVITAKSTPPKQHKAVEMAARLFARASVPKDYVKWFKANERRLALLVEAVDWPERSVDGDGDADAAEAFALGGFEVHNTVGASGQTLANTRAVIEQAVAGLARVGLEAVAYGPLYLVGQIAHENHAAWYKPTEDAVYLRPLVRGSSVEESARHLIHEMAHRYWAKKMDAEAKKTWAAHHKDLTYQKLEVTTPEVGAPIPHLIVNRKPAAFGGFENNRAVILNAKDGSRIGLVDRWKLHEWLRESARLSLFPTTYAAKDYEEHFCDAVSLAAQGKLTGEHLEALGQVLGSVRTAARDHGAEAARRMRNSARKIAHSRAAAHSSLKAQLLRLRPEIVAAAQAELDAWEPEEEEEEGDAELGFGGCCDRVSTAIAGVIDSALEDIELHDGGQDGDDHAYLIVTDAESAVIVDIPAGVYEAGGGYSWRKIPGVRLTIDDVVIEEIPRNWVDAAKQRQAESVHNLKELDQGRVEGPMDLFEDWVDSYDSVNAFEEQSGVHLGARLMAAGFQRDAVFHARTAADAVPEYAVDLEDAGDVKFVGRKGTYDVFDIFTYEGALGLGSNNWCIVRNEGTWNSYTGVNNVEFRFFVDPNNGPPAEYAAAIRGGKVEIYDRYDSLTLIPPPDVQTGLPDSTESVGELVYETAERAENGDTRAMTELLDWNWRSAVIRSGDVDLMVRLITSPKISIGNRATFAYRMLTDKRPDGNIALQKGRGRIIQAAMPILTTPWTKLETAEVFDTDLDYGVLADLAVVSGKADILKRQEQTLINAQKYENLMEVASATHVRAESTLLRYGVTYRRLQDGYLPDEYDKVFGGLKREGLDEALNQLNNLGLFAHLPIGLRLEWAVEYLRDPAKLRTWLTTSSYSNRGRLLRELRGDYLDAYRTGLSRDTWSDWVGQRIHPKMVTAWQSQGFTNPSDAGAWARLDVDPEAAAAHVEAGWSPEDYRENLYYADETTHAIEQEDLARRQRQLSEGDLEYSLGPWSFLPTHPFFEDADSIQDETRWSSRFFVELASHLYGLSPEDVRQALDALSATPEFTPSTDPAVVATQIKDQIAEPYADYARDVEEAESRVGAFEGWVRSAAGEQVERAIDQIAGGDYGLRSQLEEAARSLYAEGYEDDEVVEALKQRRMKQKLERDEQSLEGAVYLGQRGAFDAYRVDSYSAAVELGTPSWCIVRDRAVFDDYREEGAVFEFYVPKEGPPAAYVREIVTDAEGRKVVYVFGPDDEIVLHDEPGVTDLDGGSNRHRDVYRALEDLAAEYSASGAISPDSQSAALLRARDVKPGLAAFVVRLWREGALTQPELEAITAALPELTEYADEADAPLAKQFLASAVGAGPSEREVKTDFIRLVQEAVNAPDPTNLAYLWKVNHNSTNLSGLASFVPRDLRERASEVLRWYGYAREYLDDLVKGFTAAIGFDEYFSELRDFPRILAVASAAVDLEVLRVTLRRKLARGGALSAFLREVGQRPSSEVTDALIQPVLGVSADAALLAANLVFGSPVASTQTRLSERDAEQLAQRLSTRDAIKLLKKNEQGRRRPATGRLAQQTRRPWVCVDLDGTLLSYESGDAARGKFGDVLPGAADALRELASLGWRITIHTARFDTADATDPQAVETREVIEDILRKAEVPFDDVWIGPKPRCDWFIDDRALHFDGDWASVLEELVVGAEDDGDEGDDGARQSGDGLMDTVDSGNDFEDGGMGSRRDRSIQRPPGLEDILH